MVEVATVMDRITHTLVILLVVVTGEVLNPHLTSNITMLTDISPIVHGEQVVMERTMAIEVPELVKE